MLRVAEVQLRICKKNRVRELELVFVQKDGAPTRENVLASLNAKRGEPERFALMICSGLNDIASAALADIQNATKIKMNGKLVETKEVQKRLKKSNK